MTSKSSSTATDEYEVPQALFDEVCERYEIYPKIDVAATEENSKCNSLYDKRDDALTCNWSRDFFMNPPYSQTKQWIEYAFAQKSEWNVNALILINSNTDTHYWHKYIENRAEVHFQEGRIKFLLNGKSIKICPRCKIRCDGLNFCYDCNCKTKLQSSKKPSAWIISRKFEAGDN